MPPFDPVAGYIPRTAAEWLALRQRQVEDAFNGGAPLDWPGSDKVLGDLLAGEALVLSELERGTLLQLATALDPGSATGAMLDNHLEFLGGSRRPGTFTTASVTITAPLGTPIPTGTQFVSAPGADGIRHRFVTTGDVLTTTSPQTINVRSTDVGAVVLPAGAIQTCLSPVPGLVVTGSSATAPGSDVERDDEARLSRRDLLRGFGSATVGAIQAAVLRSSAELRSVRVVENDTDVPTVIGGLALARNSIAVVIYPSTVTQAALNDVATAIYATKAGGIGTNGTTIVTLNLESGPKDIRVQLAADVAVTVGGTINVAASFNAPAVLSAVEASLAAYFARLEPGDTVIYAAVLGAVGSVPGVTGMNITVNGGTANLAFDLEERPVLTSTVTVV
jgi:uncharacterized phage protein gp47/JayE